MFLTAHYTQLISTTFNRVIGIYRHVNYRWLLWILHINFYFFLHTRNLLLIIYNIFKHTWISDAIILFITIATVFLSFVLLWTNISLWGALITNLVSAINLARFFKIHFLFLFIIVTIVIIHLLFWKIHQTASNNPLEIDSNIDKVPFHPYLLYKHILGFLIILILLAILILYILYVLGDFIPANPVVTTAHIQPIYYSLFPYTILWAIPNKLWSTIALITNFILLTNYYFLNTFT